MTDKLRVGIIGKAQGIRGEVRVHPTMDTLEDFLEIDKVILMKSRIKDLKELTVQKARIQKNFCIVKFKEIEDRNNAELLNGAELYINREDAPELEEGEYYYSDIIGCTVITDEGKTLGVLKDIYETGANDVYSVVNESKKEYLLPAIDDVILDVDVLNKVMKVHMLNGLEDLN
ncbi:MAG: ribosome maturation factor RimM [Lachnospiraceae bacterium]|nr:ribosome maturation factor RimM [Lachnospiraceae bacterium]